MSEYWLNPNKVSDTNYASFKKLYKEKLAKLYTDNLMNELQMSSKCSLYKNFKVELKMEKYLCVLPNPLKFALIKFRTSNHKLPIETGRYDNTERKDRICTLCSVKDIGDEYHYLFSCQYFNDIRLLYVPKKYVSKPSVAKYLNI